MAGLICSVYPPFFPTKRTHYHVVNNSVCMSHAQGSAEHKETCLSQFKTQIIT